MHLDATEIRIQEQLGQGDAGLHTIARWIDEIDPYTYGHSERVSQYAVALGRFMDLGDEAVELLRRAGLLHDVGKILLPGVVLHQRTRLQEADERQLVAHPRKGADVVATQPGWEAVADAIRGHHERVDGRGYPACLTAEEIPASARILAVVDAFDKMVTNRPYRNALPVEEALGQIRRGAGSRFDAVFVASFVQLIRDRRDARAERLGASTLFVELSLREHEGAVRYYARKQPAALPITLADQLCREYAEVAREDAIKIAQHILRPDQLGDDLYSADVIRDKPDEVRVGHPARLDADVGSVVRFDGQLYNILAISEREDGSFEYLLKR